MVRSRSLFAGGSWGTGSVPSVATSIFFSLIVFLPFPFLLFILTAVDPVSFARFLRKRISSYDIQGTAYYLVWPKYRVMETACFDANVQ